MRRLWLATAVVTVTTALCAGPAHAQAPPSGALVDVAAAAGLAEVNKTWAATRVDYDRDGLEDVWIGYHQHTGKLWHNDGDGSYTRVAPAAWPIRSAEGLTVDRHDCAWADVDHDGRPDAYCSAGRNLDNVVKTGRDNELWLQLSPGVFTERGTEYGVGDVCGRGRHVAFLDVNRDGWPDLFLGNEPPRTGVDDPCQDPDSPLPNVQSKLFLNNAGKSFTYAPQWGVHQAGPGQRCAEVVDYDSDGRPDLLTCNFKGQPPKLFHNEGNKLVDRAAGAGLTTEIGDAVVVDLDADGRPDLVTANDSEFAYRLNRGGSFAPSVRIGAVPKGKSGRSVAAGDIDGDGDLDVYGLVADRKNGTGNPDDILFLNSGLHFTGRAVPPATGDGDEVVALHPGGSRATFLVLNGHLARSGPVQLIAMPG